jgi:hypothetical protein
LAVAREERAGTSPPDGVAPQAGSKSITGTDRRGMLRDMPQGAEVVAFGLAIVPDGAEAGPPTIAED